MLNMVQKVQDLVNQRVYPFLSFSGNYLGTILGIRNAWMSRGPLVVGHESFRKWSRMNVYQLGDTTGLSCSSSVIVRIHVYLCIAYAYKI